MSASVARWGIYASGYYGCESGCGWGDSFGIVQMETHQEIMFGVLEYHVD